MERRMDLHRTPMNLAILLRLFIKTGSLLIQCAIKNHNLVIMAILPLVPPFSHTPQAVCWSSRTLLLVVSRSKAGSNRIEPDVSGYARANNKIVRHQRKDAPNNAIPSERRQRGGDGACPTGRKVDDLEPLRLVRQDAGGECVRESEIQEKLHLRIALVGGTGDVVELVKAD